MKFIKTKSPIDRLLEKIEIITESGCWIFMGYLSDKGYGMIGNEIDCHAGLAHRMSYRLFIGAIPDGLKVCHSCDVPQCCNPYHLFVGTQQDNMDDCSAKKRKAVGEKNGKSKLSDAQVALIRETKKAGGNMKQLSKSLPVSYWQVIAISNGYRRCNRSRHTVRDLA